MRRLLAIALVACAAAAHAQQPPCTDAKDVEPAQLVGLWRAEVEGDAPATLLLEPHPRYRGSLSGEIDRNGTRSRLAADIDDGELTLEESADGVRISATWLGDVAAGSCGREIRGTREAGEGAPQRLFVLRKLDR
jgi:hypothetical protein